MKKSILIVEDDDAFRSTLKSLLSRKYEIHEASNGKTARELIVLRAFDLVITDIQMPFFTGVELLDWIKKNKPMPVMLMTGFSQILETKKAHELGADDFLAKPFPIGDLFDKIRALLNETAPLELSEPPKNRDDQFCAVSIEDFISEKEIEYNVYLKLAGDKYLKIVHKGGKIDEERVRAYKEKGISQLYVHVEDFARLVGFSVSVAKVLKNSKLDIEKKARFLAYTGELIVQSGFVSEINDLTMKHAKDFLDNSLNVLTEDQETFELVGILRGHADQLYAHSLAVSLFSVMIAKVLGWQSPQTMFKLAFGALFHDIGKKEISKAILDKPRSLLSQNEREILETHVSRGRDVMASLRSAPSEVIDIVFSHHEDFLGQGYPRRIGKKEIHPLTAVVSVANVFCEYVIPSSPQDLTKSPAEAFAAIERFKAEGLEPAAYAALKSLFTKSAPATRGFI